VVATLKKRAANYRRIAASLKKSAKTSAKRARMYRYARRALWADKRIAQRRKYLARQAKLLASYRKYAIKAISAEKKARAKTIRAGLSVIRQRKKMECLARYQARKAARLRAQARAQLIRKCKTVKKGKK
jgi:hypothetical protein